MPIAWGDEGRSAVILDQTLLPEHTVYRELRTLEDYHEAIGSLRVRGAPLIGITAAMGVAGLAAAEPGPGLAERVRAWCEHLAGARPTAVNLRWALDRMLAVALRDPADLAAALRAEADAIKAEDEEMCRRIGENALRLLGDTPTVLTHCNAGALATGGIGTALAPVYLAHQQGHRVKVYADETRPLLQGSRLTAWELAQAGVEVTIIADNTAGALMAFDPPDAVLVGADRIAANGDTANKIGTYPLAVLARHHGVPFYVLAPTSTLDLSCPDGAAIPIEVRAADEVRRGFGVLTAPPEVEVWSPAFDVTPAGLITAIITDRGVFRPPYESALAAAVAGS